MTKLDRFSQKINARAKWDDLILPPEQITLLNEMTDRVACCNQVYDDWGFGEKLDRRLGISVLFAGASGTGKTMAAEVLSNALELDLYRVYLSLVVSKYIGETEQNLRRLFKAAEDRNVILLFDEADALFGKRSEVKDAHDRYANTEVEYLLRRMEFYPGLAILATRLKSSLSPDFVRRFRFIVDFPFPGASDRERIWKRVFPPSTPVDNDLDYRRLAELELTGGSIQNVALDTAFSAARQGTPVTMASVLKSSRIERELLKRITRDSDSTS